MSGGGDTQTLDDDGAVAAVAVTPGRPGAMVGRYQLLRVLGAGGMGTVYAARDPELDREVALKLVSHGGGTQGEARLVREARAMARLQHPNVVAVHDVGISDGRVFVAMDLVDGTTLRDWVATEKPGWREVVEAFVQAGRGLAAAHQAGIVHRDFKPENVLVGRGGEVRVADFGLARPAGQGAPPGEAVDLLTTADAGLVGTPAYMAPEQHQPGEVTSAVDQYAFCVALWELALGARPFAGATVEELAAAKRAGRIAEPPRTAPRWLLASLRRGLHPSPAARHRSIEALVDVLARGLARRGRAIVASALATAVIGAGGLAWTLGSDALDEARSACGNGRARWAGLWDREQAGELRAAFAGSARPHAGAAADRAAAMLDDGVVRWSETHLAICEAGARGEVMAAVTAARQRCLDDVVVTTGATVASLIAHPLDGVIDDVETTIAGLPSAGDCLTSAELEARSRDPSLLALLEEAEALLAGGQLDRAAAVARQARDAGLASGDPIAVAAARLTTGKVLRELADPSAHVELRAAAEAARDHGAWAMAADAYQTLVDDRAMHGDTAELEALLAAARAAVSRVVQPRLRLELAQSEVAALLAMGRPGEAAEACRSSLADGQRLFGARSHRLAIGLAYCADVDFARDDNQAAFDKLTRARDLLIAELGPDHPKVGDVQHGLGIANRRLGHLEEARRQYQAALVVRERVHGAASSYVADSLNSLSIVLQDLGEIASSLETARRALVAAEQAFGADSRRTAAAHMLLAGIAQAAGEADTARVHADRGFAIFEAHPEDPDIELAYARIQWAEILIADHQPEPAERSAAAAAAILEPAGDPALLYALAYQGRAALDRGAPAAAIGPLERALALATAGQHGPQELAEIEIDLGKALWRGARDRSRAVTLVKTARRRLVEVGAADEPLARDAEAWLRDPR